MKEYVKQKRMYKMRSYLCCIAAFMRPSEDPAPIIALVDINSSKVNVYCNHAPKMQSKYK